MMDKRETYEYIRGGGGGIFEQSRGLIMVWGGEAIRFMDGLISNDMKTLADGGQMLAAFPNAQGRLLAIVRILRQGDRFLFETEEATREKVFQYLFRFTFAGDFFVEDISTQYQYFEIFGKMPEIEVGFTFASGTLAGHFVSVESVDAFRLGIASNEVVEISRELYDTLRIERGVPAYGVDVDETTVVPELGIEGLISYNKGCYIGQEIIARIHFRGHVAKRLMGLLFSETSAVGVSASGLVGPDLTAADGRNAGRITSFTYSPQLARTIAMAFVRYDYIEPGTRLYAQDASATVTALPFIC